MGRESEWCITNKANKRNASAKENSIVRIEVSVSRGINGRNVETHMQPALAFYVEVSFLFTKRCIQGLSPILQFRNVLHPQQRRTILCTAMIPHLDDTKPSFGAQRNTIQEQWCGRQSFPDQSHRQLVP